MTDSATVTVVCQIQAAPAEVCRGFTHRTLLRDWLCHHASTEPQRGGHLFLHWRNGRTVTGAYEQLDAPDGLRFSWSDSELPLPSVVEAACEAVEGGTRLTLRHSARDGAALPGESAEKLRAFWEEGLENLASVLERGVDLRFARRPRLGIFFDELTPKAAEKLGAPVQEGVLLEGTMEGTGAQAAGLEKGDILVSLNGTPLVNYNSFEVALRGLKAGDRPVVEYYRGAEKRSAPLELSSFPIMELPDSAAELAARAREVSERLLTDLRAQLEGVSDALASARPAEGEWSVKEQAAHLVLMERDFQSWAADMINDTPAGDYLEDRPNVAARQAALIARLGSLEALLDEYGLARAETVAMIENFPENFVRERKHLFRRTVEWQLDNTPGHYYEEHKEQIQEALQAAEKAAA